MLFSAHGTRASARGGEVVHAFAGTLWRVIGGLLVMRALLSCLPRPAARRAHRS